MLRNGSGIIRQRIIKLFGSELSDKDLRRLAALIYYPVEKLEKIKNEGGNLKDFYHLTVQRLVAIADDFTSIYTKRKIDRLLSREYGLIISELLQGKATGNEKAHTTKNYWRLLLR